MEPRRILVVANQTACGDELLEAVEAGRRPGRAGSRCSCRPHRRHEHATWTEGDAKAIARGRMAAAVERFLAEGAAVEGIVGDANPVRAIDDVLLEHPHDEIILSTLPPGDLAVAATRTCPTASSSASRLPVTTVISAASADDVGH